jgi:urea carboxylase
MANRYSFGGDEHLFVECSDEMSMEAFFKSLSMTNAIRDSAIKGVTEICPSSIPTISSERCKPSKVRRVRPRR